MRIHHFRVAQLRRFRQPVLLNGFGTGINLFTGPNESGKSTLVRALRAAFFERHRSRTVRDLLPWEDSAAAPEITIHFEADGRSWQLSKRFLHQPRCDLQVEGERYTGDEAEEQLARLLGYELPGRGASRPEHQGIPGLLWTEQGDGHHIRQPVVHAGDQLKLVLGQSLGELISSGGDALLEEVSRLRGELLTPTGRPTGALREVEEQYDELALQRAALQQQVQEYRDQVDELARLQLRHRKLQAEQPWASFAQQAREARERLAAVTLLKREQERDRRELDSHRQALGHIQSRMEALQRQGQELLRRRVELAAAEEELNRLKHCQLQLESQLEVARQQRDELHREREQLRRVHRRQELSRQHSELGEDIEDRQRRLKQAREWAEAQARLRQSLLERPIDPELLQKLRRLEQEHTELTIRQQTIATRLHYELEPGQRIQLGKGELRGRGEAQLLQPEILHIEGVGKLRIVPGGSDVERLDGQLREVTERREQLLQQLDAASLEQVEARQRRAEVLQQELQQIQSALKGCAPSGVEALAEELERLRHRQTRHAAELAELRDSSDAGFSEPLDPARFDQLEEALGQAEETLTRLSRQEREAREEWVRAAQAVASARSEHDRLAAEESSPERLAQEQELQRQLALTIAAGKQLEQTLNQRQQDIDQARPELLQQDVERLEASATAARREAEQCQRDLDRLQAALEARGAEGLEEREAELQARLDHLQRRHQQLQRRACALDLLQQKLQHHRRELTRQLQAPLQRHLSRYLNLLFPDARLLVDEDLVPERLIRAGLEEGSQQGDYDALSFGAREQMGLISRLAYADLLKEAGRPTLIILDDALVHSDDGRLEQMKRVLYDAAQRHQILLFTCQPDKWQGLGVEARSIVGLGQE